MTREEAILYMTLYRQRLVSSVGDLDADIEAFDIAIEALQTNIIRCKDCKHRPTGTGANHDLEFPDDDCPCQCADDYWYSWMPKDDWFCADGERKEE